MSDEDEQWFRDDLRQELQASEAHVMERMRGIETTLLAEFHKLGYACGNA